ncbi:cell division control protein 14, SIN component-domain-containing protein [Mycena alexandri]|uniref:Cell division control protein 14, SIN component-domain-containing protein n=1 Tax=Mycena alexandri TaxID=1745969 RepID=A0AAD6SUN3_9AGAR|nr:cell division control protein 14, SIN component-domain-containing protein [Mycena alexandri]
MEDLLSNLRRSLEDALDDLSSPRTSSDTKTQALRGLEKLLAAAFVPKASTEELDYFLALQYTFECNVPSRILAWIASATFRLDLLTDKGAAEAEAEPEVATLSSQLTVALSIIQGVCLTHAPTKVYLGRRYALEVLLDLFLSSRHLSSTPFTSAAHVGNVSSASPSPAKLAPGAPLPLASVILDTLLCILVDSSPALRVFEACHGVHAVVKILKRAGTPREVRMKCLEFLYFYLLDETSSTPHVPTTSTPTPTAPSTPVQSSTNRKPFISNTPGRPVSRYGSSTFSSLTSGAFASAASSSFSTSSSTSNSSGSSRSTSGSSSSSSFSSTSSNAGSHAAAPLGGRGGTSPKKPSQAQSLPNVLGTPRQNQMHTPKRSTSPKKMSSAAQPRALLMLRRDLDFVPLSPKVGSFGAGANGIGTGKKGNAKRAVVVGEDGVPLGRARRMGSGSGVGVSSSRLVSAEGSEDGDGEYDATARGERTESEGDGEGEYDSRMDLEGEDTEGRQEREGEQREQRTTDEKKRLLGTMLGNVEALVEGVRKAGIWGLG